MGNWKIRRLTKRLEHMQILVSLGVTLEPILLGY